MKNIKTYDRALKKYNEMTIGVAAKRIWLEQISIKGMGDINLYIKQDGALGIYGIEEGRNSRIPCDFDRSVGIINNENCIQETFEAAEEWLKNKNIWNDIDEEDHSNVIEYVRLHYPDKYKRIEKKIIKKMSTEIPEGLVWDKYNDVIINYEG